MRAVGFIFIALALLPISHGCMKERSCENCVQTKGKAFFYTLNGCVNSRPVKLIIDDHEYLAELANFSVPECGGPGVIAIDLPAGKYKYESKCEFPGSTETGTVNVIENACNKAEL